MGNQLMSMYRLQKSLIPTSTSNSTKPSVPSSISSAMPWRPPRPHIPPDVPYYDRPDHWASSSSPDDLRAFPHPESYSAWQRESQGRSAAPASGPVAYPYASGYNAHPPLRKPHGAWQSHTLPPNPVGQAKASATGTGPGFSSSRSYHSGPSRGKTPPIHVNPRIQQGNSQSNPSRPTHTYVPPASRMKSPPPPMTSRSNGSARQSRATTPNLNPRDEQSSTAFKITLPSDDYLRLSQLASNPSSSSSSSTPSPEIKTKLLVLDLNGTLLYRPKGVTRGGHPRPYLQNFLEYLFLPEPEPENTPTTRRPWEVFVWSSAKPHNVRPMVEKAFGERWIEGVWEPEDPEAREDRHETGEGRLLGVWARDKLGLTAVDYGEWARADLLPLSLLRILCLTLIYVFSL
jgi:hypothetical protein